ncbi:MAG: hypothetical protein ACE5ID_09655, partial [Acidobacteriota bacterium]
MGRRRLAGEKGASSGALFLCIGLLAVTAVVPASDNLTGVLPADNQVVLSISDAPALLAFVESLSLTGDLTPEDTSSLLAGLLEPAQMQALQQYLKGLSDLEHLLSSRVTGQMVLAVPETPGLNADPGELQRIILLAETDLDDGKMQEFLSSLLAATGVSPAATEDVDSHGVTLHLLHRSAEKDSRRHPGGWSVVKG